MSKWHGCPVSNVFATHTVTLLGCRSNPLAQVCVLHNQILRGQLLGAEHTKQASTTFHRGRKASELEITEAAPCLLIFHSVPLL